MSFTIFFLFFYVCIVPCEYDIVITDFLVVLAGSACHYYCPSITALGDMVDRAARDFFRRSLIVFFCIVYNQLQ